MATTFFSNGEFFSRKKLFRFSPFIRKRKREGTSGTAAGRRERRVRCPRGGSRKAGPPFSDNRTRSDRGAGEPGRWLWGREAPERGEGKEGKERGGGKGRPANIPFPPSLPSFPPLPPQGGGALLAFFCLWAENENFWWPEK